jgi:hypothetical protein
MEEAYLGTFRAVELSSDKRATGALRVFLG